MSQYRTRQLTSDTDMAMLLHRECIIFNRDTQQDSFEIMSDAWTEEFCQYPKALLDEAFKAHRRHLPDGRFFPTFANIHDQIQNVLAERLNPVWDAVKKLISTYGKYYSLDLKDPRLHYAIEKAGGWVKLCSSSNAELVQMKTTVLRAYAEASMLPPEQLPKHLSGLHEEEGCPVLKTPDMAKYLPPGASINALLTIK